MNYQIISDIIAARPKALAFLAFLAVLTLALFLYVSSFQRPELEKVQKEWFAKRDALASRQQGVPGVEQYQKGIRDLALFQRRLIPKRQFPAFLGRVFQSGKSHALVISQVAYKPAAVKDQPGVISYGIGFTVTGTYPAVKALIADLERYPEMVVLDSVSLSSRSAVEEQVELKMQLTAYVTTEGA